MASIGQLVRVVAEAAALEESGVKLIARYLREASLIGQKSTGGGAAKMTARDAANLLIAVNACELAKDSASTVNLFREFVCIFRKIKIEPNNLVSIVCEEGRKFGPALEMLIGGSVTEKDGTSYLEKEIGKTKEASSSALVQAKVTFTRPVPIAKIELQSTHIGDIIRNKNPLQPESVVEGLFEGDYARSRKFGDRIVSCFITDRTLKAVGDLIAT